MTAQPTFSQIRAALAATLTSAIPGLNVYPDRAEQITVPAAIILPIQGSFISYATTDGGQNISLRAVLCVAKADSTGGQALMDPYLATSGPQSVFAAIAADAELGGTVQYASVTEVTGYGPLTVGDIAYLAAHFIISIGI